MVDRKQSNVGDTGLYKALLYEYGMRYIRHSAIADPSTEAIFRSFLRGKTIRKAVETGTHFGVSACILAHYAERVATMDINQFDNEAEVLWKSLRITDKIDYYILGGKDDEKEKRLVLNEVGEFDFAFIDGNHRDGVILDWNLLKSCGRVLFHDYFTDPRIIPGMRPEWGAKISPFILDLVDSLPQNEVTIREPFAYWEKNGKV